MILQHRPKQYGRQATTKTSSRNEFGAPHRRMTDFLLVLNAAVYIAQYFSKDRLLLLGAKVLHANACLFCCSLNTRPEKNRHDSMYLLDDKVRSVAAQPL